jgi:hypothetical protein
MVCWQAMQKASRDIYLTRVGVLTALSRNIKAIRAFSSGRVRYC